MTWRCGDVVRHKPSGETWQVAYDDPDTGYLAPAGWPPCEVKRTECELIELATDDKYRRMVGAWSKSRGDDCYDSRKNKILKLYGKVLEGI